MLLDAHCDIWQLTSVLQLSRISSPFSAPNYLHSTISADSFAFEVHQWRSTLKEANFPKSPSRGVPSFWCGAQRQQLELHKAAVCILGGRGVLLWHWRRELLSPPSGWNFLDKSHFQILVLPSLLKKESWKAALITSLYQMRDFRTMDSNQSFPPGK